MFHQRNLGCFERNQVPAEKEGYGGMGGIVVARGVHRPTASTFSMLYAISLCSVS